MVVSSWPPSLFDEDDYPLPGEGVRPLDVLTKEEFREVAREFKGLTDKQFEALWQERMEAQRRRYLQ